MAMEFRTNDTEYCMIVPLAEGVICKVVFSKKPQAKHYNRLLRFIDYWKELLMDDEREREAQ